MSAHLGIDDLARASAFSALSSKNFSRLTTVSKRRRWHGRGLQAVSTTSTLMLLNIVSGEVQLAERTRWVSHRTHAAVLTDMNPRPQKPKRSAPRPSGDRPRTAPRKRKSPGGASNHVSGPAKARPSKRVGGRGVAERTPPTAPTSSTPRPPLQRRARPEADPKAGVDETKIVVGHDPKKYSRRLFSTTATFESLGLCERLVDTLKGEMGLSRPTRIQAVAVPMALTGRDVMFKSKTGTGKTLGFLLPVVHNLQNRQPRLRRADGTRAIVVAPTRELVLQIHHVSTLVLKPFHWLVTTTVMGGERKKSEKGRLRKGATLVVATPGRLLDHLLTTSAFDVTRIEVLVLDEADRLLDMGFERDIQKILGILDKRKADGRRQTILTSATLTGKVQDLAHVSLRRPLKAGLKDEDEALKGDEMAAGSEQTLAGERRDVLPENLKQSYIRADSRYRLTALAAFLRSNVQRGRANGSARKVVVFVSTCDSVEFHHQLLGSAWWPPVLDDQDDDDRKPFLDTELYRLHGNIEQKERTRTYFKFCNAKEGILFCTDVAARGLDLPAVDWIVQFDPPDNTDTYVHRVGRTARMGQKGRSVIFLQRAESDYIGVLEERGMQVSEMGLVQVLAELNVDDDEAGGNADMPPGLQLQKQLERLVQTNAELHELAQQAFLSSVRAYGAYPKAMKPIFHLRKLHLGCVAQSFGLKEQPKQLARMQRNRMAEARRAGKRGGGGRGKEERPGRNQRRENPRNRKRQKRVYGDDLRAKFLLDGVKRGGGKLRGPTDITSEFAS